MAHNCHNCSHTTNTSTQQTLDELDFERGIWTAVIYQDVESLEKHIQNGRIEDRDNSGYTALHYAARSGNMEIFKRLVSAGANLNAKTNGGATAFHRAAMQGHDQIIAFLLKQQKIDANLTDCDGQTALHRAAQNGHYSTAKLILAEFEHLRQIRDIHSRTPFDLVPAGDQYDPLRKELAF